MMDVEPTPNPSPAEGGQWTAESAENAILIILAPFAFSAPLPPLRLDSCPTPIPPPLGAGSRPQRARRMLHPNTLCAFALKPLRSLRSRTAIRRYTSSNGALSRMSAAERPTNATNSPGSDTHPGTAGS